MGLIRFRKDQMMIIASFCQGLQWEILITFRAKIKGNALELNFSLRAKGPPNAFGCRSYRGVRGYRLRLNPAAKNIVLSMDEYVFGNFLSMERGSVVEHSFSGHCHVVTPMNQPVCNSSFGQNKTKSQINGFE